MADEINEARNAIIGLYNRGGYCNGGRNNGDRIHDCDWRQ